MKSFPLILAILVIILPISAMDAGELDLNNQVIEDWHNTTYYYSGCSGDITNTANWAVNLITFQNIEDYDDIYLMKLYAPDGYYSISGTGGTYVIRNASGYHISEGEIFTWNTGTGIQQFQIEPDFWKRGSLSGTQTFYFDLYGISINTLKNAYYGDAPMIFESASFSTHGASSASEIYTRTSDYTKIIRQGIVADNETCLYIQRFDFIRENEVSGLSTESHIHFEDANGTVYHNSTGLTNIYNISTITAPLSVLIDYGGGVRNYNWSGSSTCFPETTPTPTATPTPGTNLCQYWTLTLNTSNINRNEAVLATLSETDPEDRFDMIDWYRVLPNGNEYITKHYVYDAGLFGLGAGWFRVNSYTGYTEASSVNEALENEIDFTTSGGAHYVRVRIYDDKSLFPLIYHDYDHVCTKEAIVYVGETTQSLTQQGINVYEADTNAFLTGVSLSVYDYGTGEWQNKTSAYGATTYFNAVPGHSMRVLANLSGWLPSDSTFTISNPPVTYPVYLKRPLVDIENKSYVFFNVRDSVTHTGLYQATIQLSDGQLQSTMPSGYAGFSVNDSESYYYTVSKPGYQKLTSTFSISEDTTIPILLVQIAPTPTLTFPITTMPTVTVTNTITPTGTGTTGVTATATGTYSNATLAPADRVQKTTKAVDVWYTNAETISNLLFLAVIVGILGLMSNAMDKRRRRR